MKRIATLAIFTAIAMQGVCTTPTDTVKSVVKPISEKTFVAQSNLIADQLDSLMELHVFTYTKKHVPANYDSTLVPTFSDEVYKKRLAELNAKTPLELDFNPVVRRFIDLYALRRREQVGRMLGLAEYYFPMFEEVLDRYNMPLELKYLAVVESALNPAAKSRVGATGLWQFMYGTGKMMGLNTSSYVDERSDPYKSTVAACEYMTRMYKMFGDWNLVLAAYNSGPGNVNKAIRRSGGKKSYWELRPYLPRETAGYVPAFIAATYVMSYAKEHNLYPTQEVPFYATVDTIFVKNQISFTQLEMWLGVDREIIEFLNPSYKLDIIPKVKGQKHFLVLPNQTMGLFVQNEDSLYHYAALEFEQNKSTMPTETAHDAENRIKHKVKSGESLGLIASKYGTTVSKIKQWNGLRSNMIRTGQSLTIYTKASSTKSSNTASTNTTEENGNTYYVVRKGDTLYDIARKFPGVSSSNLSEWNNINDGKIQAGMKLVVKKGSSSN